MRLAKASPAAAGMVVAGGIRSCLRRPERFMAISSGWCKMENDGIEFENGEVAIPSSRPRSLKRFFCEKAKAAGWEVLRCEVSGNRMAWGACRREGGPVRAALLEEGGADGHSWEFVPQEGLTGQPGCPERIFRMLACPGGHEGEGDPGFPGLAWYSGTSAALARAREDSGAQAFFSPDGVSTGYGIAHGFRPVAGQPGLMKPIWDDCTRAPARRLNVLMDKVFLEEQGGMPLAVWRPEIWEAVSCRIAALDYRGLGGDSDILPIVKANFSGTFNSRAFAPHPSSFEAGCRLVMDRAADGAAADISCDDLRAVWESGMRGRIVCGVPVKIVEYVDGSLPRVRYPLDGAGICPWTAAYRKACRKAESCGTGGGHHGGSR